MIQAWRRDVRGFCKYPHKIFPQGPPQDLGRDLYTMTSKSALRASRKISVDGFSTELKSFRRQDLSKPVSMSTLPQWERRSTHTYKTRRGLREVATGLRRDIKTVAMPQRERSNMHAETCSISLLLRVPRNMKIENVKNDVLPISFSFWVSLLSRPPKYCACHEKWTWCINSLAGACPPNDNQVPEKEDNLRNGLFLKHCSNSSNFDKNDFRYHRAFRL